MDRVIRSQPLVLPATHPGNKVFLHPSAVVIAFIATALAWSYSEEANVKQYDWKVAEDGTVHPDVAWAGNMQNSSILRDAVLSKVESANGSIENAANLSSRFVLAASVAAIAIVAELVAKPDIIEVSHPLVSESQGSDEDPSAAQTASSLTVGAGALMELGSYASSGQPKMFGLLGDEVAVAVNEAESGHPSIGPSNSSSLPDVDIAYQASRLFEPSSVVRTELDVGLSEHGLMTQLLLRADPPVESGPVSGIISREKVSELVADAVDKGANVVTGGEPTGDRGYFYKPTVLAGVPQGARVLTEEIFGPVAPVITFADDDQAIAAANATEYGLAAYVFAQDIGRAFHVIDRLETGMIGFNQGMVSNAGAPFGGVKQSGFGREGGPEGLKEYLSTKYVALNVR